MTPEKDAALCEKYPKIFRNRNAPKNETAMYWGLACGDGWYTLIDVLCANIQNHVDWLIQQQKFKIERGEIKPEDARSDEHFQVVAAQVKEKFGGLRFYVDGADPEVLGMIHMAESMSYKICEGCGVPGEKRGGGWIRVLCASCEEARQNRKSKTIDV